MRCPRRGVQVEVGDHDRDLDEFVDAEVESRSSRSRSRPDGRGRYSWVESIRSTTDAPRRFRRLERVIIDPRPLLLTRQRRLERRGLAPFLRAIAHGPACPRRSGTRDDVPPGALDPHRDLAAAGARLAGRRRGRARPGRTSSASARRRSGPATPLAVSWTTPAPVAQRIEQEPSNLLVAGSIPAGGTPPFDKLRDRNPSPDPSTRSGTDDRNLTLRQAQGPRSRSVVRRGARSSSGPLRRAAGRRGRARRPGPRRRSPRCGDPHRGRAAPAR